MTVAEEEIEEIDDVCPICGARLYWLRSSGEFLREHICIMCGTHYAATELDDLEENLNIEE